MEDFYNNCTICNIQSENALEEDWVFGFIGLLGVSFCPNCYNGIVDMVETLENESLDDEVE